VFRPSVTCSEQEDYSTDEYEDEFEYPFNGSSEVDLEALKQALTREPGFYDDFYSSDASSNDAASVNASPVHAAPAYADSACAASGPQATGPCPSQFDEPTFLLRAGKSSLISLSQTCKFLRTVVQPIVYHTLFFSDAQCTPYRLVNIMKLFKVRPDLSASLSDLYLDDYPFWAGDKYERMAKTKQGPLVASFLQLVPNLQHAHIRMPAEEYQGLSKALESKSSATGTSRAPPPQSLQLKHLGIEGRRPDPSSRARQRITGSVDTDTWLGPLLKLTAASLETLAFYQSVEATKRFAASLGRKSLKDPAPLYNLTELTLVENRRHTENSLDLQSLRNILQAVGPNLAKVRIEEPSWGEDPPTDTPERITITNLLKNLRPWKETMREISLCYPAENWRTEIEVDTALLAEFKNLEGISFAVTAGDAAAFVAALSPRLRRLRLMDDPPRGLYPRIIQCLLDATIEGRFPNLKTVWVKEPQYEYEIDDEDSEDSEDPEDSEDGSEEDPEDSEDGSEEEPEGRYIRDLLSTARFGPLFWDAAGVRYTSEPYRPKKEGISDAGSSSGDLSPMYSVNSYVNRRMPREWEEVVYNQKGQTNGLGPKFAV